MVPVAGVQEGQGVFSFVALLLDPCPSFLANALP